MGVFRLGILLDKVKGHGLEYLEDWKYPCLNASKASNICHRDSLAQNVRIEVFFAFASYVFDLSLTPAHKNVIYDGVFWIKERFISS